MTTVADLTPPRLSQMLGCTVTHVAVDRVGSGNVGECYRLTPSYAEGAERPTSLVAKLPSEDETSRAAAAAVRAYEVEVSFYRELAPSLAIRTPRCYYADLDVAANDFVLLLEDVAPAEVGDQIAGCTPDEAAAAVAELPGLHAPRWGDPSLERLPWLARSTPEQAQLFTGFIQGLHPGFLERYTARLSPEVVELSETIVRGLPMADANRPKPWTVVHSDFRLDNLLFPRPLDSGRVITVDWQTCSYGPGIGDLAYFIGGAMEADARRECERDLVNEYADRMRAAGVQLDRDELWRQYRRYTTNGLVMAIIASMLVKRTPRGDDMFMAMAERSGQHALDHDAAEFFR
jgi:hypothetical protein